ncbi:hypothetical protein INR49_022845, partial [Caranx melampygus]
RKAPRLNPRVNSNTTNKVNNKTQALIINIQPPKEYINATPAISPRNTENSANSSADPQEDSYHPPQNNPDTTTTISTYAIIYIVTGRLPQVSGYGSAAKAAEYANTTSIPPR